jgi:hypothetical protein
MAASLKQIGARGALFFGRLLRRVLAGDLEPMNDAGDHFRLTFDKATEFYQLRESGLSGTRTKACYVLVFMVIIPSLA